MGCPVIDGTDSVCDRWRTQNPPIPPFVKGGIAKQDTFVHHHSSANGASVSLNGIPTGVFNNISGLFAAPPTNLNLPKPSQAELPQILYKIFSQLKDFELTGVGTLPIDGLGWDGKIVKAEGSIVLRDNGRLAIFEVEFNPTTGYIPIELPVPILGPLLKKMYLWPVIGATSRVNLIEVKMDPQSRHLKARAHWIGEMLPGVGPKTQDIQDLLTKGLSKKTLTGPGYDLKKGFPKYPWQIADFVRKFIKEKGMAEMEKMASDFKKYTPLLDKTHIYLTADFSNKKISYGGATVEFAPLPKGQKHRITIKGSPFEPVVTIAGIRSAEVQYKRTTVRLENAENNIEPLTIHFKKGSRGYVPTSLEIKKYQSQHFLVEVTPEDGSGETTRLEMKKGIKIYGLTLSQGTMGPKLKIKKVVADQIAFEGFGAELRSKPKTRVILDNIEFRLFRGETYFKTDVKGRISGKIQYRKDGEKIADILVGLLQGQGSIRVRPDLIEIAANIVGELPEMNLLVQSPKIASEVNIFIKDAVVKGAARLKILPKAGEAILESTEKDPFSLAASGGVAKLRQDPSKVEKWPELKRELGEELAAKVVSEVTIPLSYISFEIPRMKLENFHLSKSDSGDKKPAAEITEAQINNIEIITKGDKEDKDLYGLYGTLFMRLPGGNYRIIDIPKDKSMKNAKLTIKQLTDSTEGKRHITLDGLTISAQASKPTISKRCGKFYQHIHVKLGRFGFSPIDRDWEIEKPDKHFHVDLNNPLMGGCIKVDTVPKKYPKKPSTATPTPPSP